MAGVQDCFDRNDNDIRHGMLSDDAADADSDSSLQSRHKKMNVVLEMLRSASKYPLSIHEDVITKLPDLDHPPQVMCSFGLCFQC